MKRTLVLCALLCLVSVPALAVQPANYATLKLGGYFPQSNDLEDFSNGFNGEIALGHRFSPMFAGEFGIGYFKTDADFAGFDPFIGTFTETDELTVIPVTLTAKAVFPVGPNAELFGGAGIGVYFAKAEADLSSSVLGSATFSDDDNAFGFHLVAGGNVNINPNVFVGGEVKYLWADASFSGTTFGVPITVDSKLDGITLTATIGFRF